MYFDFNLSNFLFLLSNFFQYYFSYTVHNGIIMSHYSMSERFDTSQRSILETSQRQPQYTSRHSLSLNESHINKMSTLIHTKYKEFGDLQQNLLVQLQNIENNRCRFQRLEGVVNKQIMTNLNVVKEISQQIKGVILPLMVLAKGTVEAVAYKAQEMLTKKVEENLVLVKQNQLLKEKIQKLKEEFDTLKRQNKLKSQNISKETPIDSYSHSQSRQQFSHSQSKSSLDLVTKFNIHRQSRINPYSQFKLNHCQPKRQQSNALVLRDQDLSNISENEVNLKQERTGYSPSCSLNRHQKYYQQIIDARKIKAEEWQLGCDRKKLIKYKIQKIKVRAQCRQYRNKSPLMR